MAARGRCPALARRHRGNPAAALRVEQLYGLPVLLSGLAGLVLGKAELAALDHHHKVKLEQLMRLYQRTPAPAVYFLAGQLPASAHLHLRQLGLLAMVARLGPTSILHRLATYTYTSLSSFPCTPSSPSLWFLQIRQTCAQYSLPDPQVVLASPPTKGAWRAATHRQVEAYWGARLRAEAATLPSLSYLRTSHLTLSSSHPIWSSCYGSQHEVVKATLQARMVSGRYRTCWLRRHWSGDASGHCRVPGCTPGTPGTLLHLATGQCAGLRAAVVAATTHWSSFLPSYPHLLPLLQEMSRAEPEVFLAFLLDPATQAPVLALAQVQGREVVDQLYFLTRSWLYTLHRERFRKLGLWEALL